jgi:uncharacterized membrane protein YidH (DUF202 family)
MSFAGRLLGFRRRSEPAVDIGLPVERTAMAWQRTALGVGGVSALLLHIADRSPLASVPGLTGLLFALLLLVVSERRYVRMIRKVAAGESPLARRVIRLVAVGVVLLSVSAVVLLLVTDV